MDSYLEIATTSAAAFANGGTIDLAELRTLTGLALRDGVVDNEEKRVLGNIFDLITKDEVTPKVWQGIQEFRRTHVF